MTNHWVDIKNADLVLIMGGNAAEAHPCGFKWVTEAKANNAARLIVVDPRFTRSASVADVYAPIRTGTDIAFLGGVISYVLASERWQKDPFFREWVVHYTNAATLITEEFKDTEELDAVTNDLLVGHLHELELFHWFVRAHLESSGGALSTAAARTEKQAARAASGAARKASASK